jgi:hypothetical protein
MNSNCLFNGYQGDEEVVREMPQLRLKLEMKAISKSELIFKDCANPTSKFNLSPSNLSTLSSRLTNNSAPNPQTVALILFKLQEWKTCLSKARDS